jgi:cysteine desulfurase
MKLPIYLDHHATTPVDPRVLGVMLPYFTEHYGNAASRNHCFGWRAEEAVETARKQVAALIGATAREIVFTSGATESNNLALKGAADFAANTRTVRHPHIITVVTEHKSVLDACRQLEERGFRITRLPVDGDGLIRLEELGQSIGEETILISVMHANNEIGVLQPIRDIGRMAREHDILFHCDAVQSAGKVPVDVERSNIDLMSLSAHKIYGPKGVGALYVRRRGRRVELAEQIAGGGHERGMRSGTLNVPGIVGFGEACSIARRELADESRRTSHLRDMLLARLVAELENVSLNGSRQFRLPNNLNVSFTGVPGEPLMRGLDDVAVSSGSACTTTSLEPSHVLTAIGVPAELANSSIRMAVGRFTTPEEIEYAASKLIGLVRQLRTTRC